MKRYIIATLCIALGAAICVDTVHAQNTAEYGRSVSFEEAESTSSNSSVDGETLMHRNEYDASNSLFGQLNGLQVLQNAGTSWNNTASFFIRGLNTSTGKAPMVFVDGFERSIAEISMAEIESVTVLKDPVSLSLYGGRGANGVILIKTKRGIAGAPKVNFSYQFNLGRPIGIPQMADGKTYAMAMNEARVNDGLSPMYSEDQIRAFADGSNPDIYPNVDWWGESIRNHSNGHNATFSIQGGSMNARYFSEISYISDTGILKPVDQNDGYSTQFNYSKMNIRTNLDVNLSPSTLLTIHLLGNFSENNRPGTVVGDIFKALYQVPSGVFPVKNSNGIWGGSTVYAINPVAQIADSGYSRAQGRTLYADMTLRHDFESVPGLSASMSMAMDNQASYWDSNTKKFAYQSSELSGSEIVYNTLREESALSFGTKVGSAFRHTNANVRTDYDRIFNERHHVSAALMYSLDKTFNTGQNQTFAYMDIVGMVHYAYDRKYLLDAAVSGSACSVLEPGNRWGYFPSVSAAWVASQEDFLKDVSAVNLLKLRASWGMAGKADYAYDLYKSKYGGGNAYYFKTPPASMSGSKEKQLGVDGLTYEKAHNTNVGVDAKLFGMLSLSADAFLNHRTDILVDNGNMSSVLGISAPKTNAGIVDNRGIELSARLDKTLANGLALNLGGNFSYVRSKIVEMNESYHPYDYLYRTGGPLNQLFGYEVIGIYSSQAEIDNRDVKQQLSDVQPGDFMYKDQNGDKIIDEYDRIPLGYNNLCPEIYYSFDLNLEYKGFGVYAMFQGAAHYSKILDARSVFRPLISNNTISTQYLENRWTPSNQDAIYPRLTANGSTNNYTNNSVWISDASFLKLRTLDVYYKLPQRIVAKAKIASAKIFLRGYDLFGIDSIPVFDAEATEVGHPLMKQYNCGISLSF